MVIKMIIAIEMVMVKIAAMPVDTTPRSHSGATRHAHSRATSERMSATKATTVGGSCD
jgi:hypothetical protein